MLTDALSISDPLSTALSRIKLQSLVAGGFDAAGRWAIKFPPLELLRLDVVINGECFIEVQKRNTVYHVRQGDCFLVSANTGFVITSDLTLKKRLSPQSLLSSRNENGLGVINGGGSVLLSGAAFRFEGHLPKVIFGSLPPVIHVPAHFDQAAILRWSIERFGAELRGRNTGRALVLSHLAPIMLLQTLRIYLQSAEKADNWLGAISDLKLSKAINLMHSSYRTNLSLEALAEAAGMSRANFALNFKKRVGLSPIEYLNHWRMQIACELLQDPRRNVLDIAEAVGYQSQGAFSSAFLRIVNCRPSVYRKTFADRTESARPRSRRCDRPRRVT